MIAIDLQNMVVKPSDKFQSKKEIYSKLKLMWFHSDVLIQYPFPLTGFGGGYYLLSYVFELPPSFVTNEGWTVEWPYHLRGE
jgi:hypothetical protein